MSTMPEPSPPAVRVVSSRAVKPPPRPRERIPLIPWDVAVLSFNYIQKGFLFAPPVPPHPLSSTADVVDHLADALADYYPVAGRFVTDQHRDELGNVVGCGGQGAEVLHAVADGVAIADVIPPDGDVPRVVRSFFPLDDAFCYDGHALPLFAVQVTELRDGLFVGFAFNHALCDGTSLWDFLNAWAEIARARFAPPGSPPASRRSSPLLLERWSPDGRPAAPAVLPCAGASELVERLAPPPLRERMIHFSAESLAALKERARGELVAAGDVAGAASLTRFQALSSLLR